MYTYLSNVIGLIWIYYIAFILLYSHNDINNNINNTGRLCCFGYKWVYQFRASAFWHEERERQIIKAYANHSMLNTPPPRTVNLVVFKTSASRDPKNRIWSETKNLWDLKGFYGSQWLRARLCCRKISDSIFWLFCFTPHWLVGVMPCPKKVHKKYTKRKR